LQITFNNERIGTPHQAALYQAKVVEQMKKPIIAIDGPAGAGKSTVAREVAKRLNIKYLDTGAMYRAVTLKVIREKIDLADLDLLQEMLANTDIRLGTGIEVYLDGEDVTEAVRLPAVNELVSPVAAIPMVRKRLVALQQSLAAETDGIIMEGRDIASRVLPDADYKFYLDASLEERSKRRGKEQEEKGVKRTLQEVSAEIEKRDSIDSQREDSPLVIVPDALIINTTAMTIEEVVNVIVEVAKKAK
jgi:CMP/dCMP kinase